jgi:hypothetical protein
MNPKELLEKLKHKREEAEAIRAYWAEKLSGLKLPEEHLQSWLITYDFETIAIGIDAGAIQRSKRLAQRKPMTAEEAVLYASAAMRDKRYEAMSDDEKAHIHAVRSEAGKKGNAKRWEAKKQKFATGSDNLRSFAMGCDGLPATLTPSFASTLSSSGTGTSTATDTAKPLPSNPPNPNQENPKPAEAQGTLPKQEKDKTEPKFKMRTFEEAQKFIDAEDFAREEKAKAAAVAAGTAMGRAIAAEEKAKAAREKELCDLLDDVKEGDDPE